MPNRILSGEISRSDSLSRVSMEAELTFVHLISVVDDFGRFDGRPLILIASLYPTRAQEVTEEALARWLGELECEGLLRWYEIDGRRYLELSSWGKHQRKRAAHSKYPEPNGYQDLTATRRKSRSNDRNSLAHSAESRESRVESRESRSESRESRSDAALRAPPAANGDSRKRPLTDAPEELTADDRAQIQRYFEAVSPAGVLPEIESRIESALLYYRREGKRHRDWGRVVIANIVSLVNLERVREGRPKLPSLAEGRRLQRALARVERETRAEIEANRAREPLLPELSDAEILG